MTTSRLRRRAAAVVLSVAAVFVPVASATGAVSGPEPSPSATAKPTDPVDPAPSVPTTPSAPVAPSAPGAPGAPAAPGAEPAPAADRCPLVEDKMFAAVDHRVEVARITPTPYWRTDCRQLYRADGRAPQLVFEQGLHPDAPLDGRYDLSRHTAAGQGSPYVSASYDHDLYKSTVGDKPVYNYYIDAPGGVDVDRTLGAPRQPVGSDEVAFPGGVSRERIVGACPVDLAKKTETMAQCQDNPHYKPWRG
ncbi:ADP-ribosyltransferase [Streptomyces sp. NPDC127033]|uniref:ADP-ribosyltransferase n=1 Tax=Streptomyces sp. NPDC127033 TaxID=3347110 RepID=UPI003652BC85